MSFRSLPSFPLRAGRVHEVCGPAATAFAAIAAALSGGPLLWVREGWQAEVLNPLGFLPFLDPSTLLLAQTATQTDSLATAEEALKDGALPFVVLEITRPLDLREGRRLQLAAQAGGATGLCIIPEGMGSNAAETRWRARPLLDAGREDSTLMHWESIKNKSGTLGAWHVRWEPEAHRLHVVSPVGERPGSPHAPG
ncbi:MAG: ImuA family protein [Paenirhodobacter sp.]|uniref:ImuA family protein n=1 Tax=Paenirhodobacter sp. TaxID=1965326 RepID=UPI003D0F6817